MVAKHLSAYGDRLFCICKTAGPHQLMLLPRLMALDSIINITVSEV